MRFYPNLAGRPDSNCRTAVWLTGLVLWLLAAGLTGCRSDSAQSVVLVRNGRPRAVLVLPRRPDDLETLAAQEIATYLRKISGAKLITITAGQEDPPEGLIPIFIGSAATSAVPDLDVGRARSPHPGALSTDEGFVLRIGPKSIALAGLKPAGTLYAAYELLERLGCRWFWPSELGEVIPKGQTLSLDCGEQVQIPSFELRHIRLSGEGQNAGRDDNLPAEELFAAWTRRNRLTLDLSWYNAYHNVGVDLSDPSVVDQTVQRALDWFQQHPEKEWFSVAWQDQYCQVDQDQALGVMHPWELRYSASEPLIAYYNEVAERVLEKYPGKILGFLAYLNYQSPPFSVPLHPNLSPTFAPIECCARHVPGSGQCWQRDAMMQQLADWCKMSDKVIFYDYEPSFLVDGNIVMPHVSRLRVEIPATAKLGVRGHYVEHQLSIMNNGPNNYLRARLYWKADADVDALLDEYYSLLFGPAAAPVRAYWDALEEMMHNGPGHQHEDELLKSVYPWEKVKRLGKYIRQAQEAVGDDELIRRRVQVVSFSYENLKLYLRMRRAEDQADFAQAAELAQRQLSLHEQIEQINPVLYKMGNLSNGIEDLDYVIDYQVAGWIRQNQARQARTDGSAGQLVAMLPDQWQFTTDADDRGVIYRWFAPQTDTGDWKTIRTTRVWEVQGYEDKRGHGYDGVAWYRTEAEVPREFAGRKIMLNFGGVFGRMIVWVNGEFVGYRPFKLPWFENGYNVVFDIDATAAVKPGRTNTIVIRVDNQFEWGGIFRRVFLFSPRPQDDL